MNHYPVQTALTIVSVALLLMAAHRIQPSISAPSLTGFAVFRNLSEQPVEGNSTVPGQRTPQQSMSIALLQDENGALDHFYSMLAMVRSGATVRIVHYGDSPITADLISGDIRRLLQKRFGNGGHGFILLEQPWAWYQHSGVKLLSFGWHPTAATQGRLPDSYYGFGGVSFTASAPARTHYSFTGSPHDRFDLFFLQQPGGGQISISSSGRTLAEIKTAADKTAPGFQVIGANPPVSELDISVTSGDVRAFGLVAENGKAGVVYDSVGLNGASVSVLSRTFNGAHWMGQLRHRRPDLVIINYGTNEADFDDFIRKEYEPELREAIRRVHVALPKSSILIMSPMDRGYWAEPDRVESMPSIARIVQIQRKVALETGCGFFNSFAAMGGEGTIARWYRQKPPLVAADLIHPHPAGANIIATALMKEMLKGLERFQAREISATTSPKGTPE